MHTHKLWRPDTAETRMESFARAEWFCGDAAVTRAKRRLAGPFCRSLETLQPQLDEYRPAIEKPPRPPFFTPCPGSAPRSGAPSTVFLTAPIAPPPSNDPRTSSPPMPREHPNFATWMEENLPQSFTDFTLPTAHHKRLRTSNAIERLKQEIKRRTRVARLFPQRSLPPVFGFGLAGRNQRRLGVWKKISQHGNPHPSPG